MNGSLQRALKLVRPTSACGIAVLGAALLTVALQIPYPLVSDDMQRGLTISSVLSFSFASVLHAFDSRGVRAAVALVVVCVGGGVLAEAVGWRTGVPFGNYRYNDTLGVKVLGVPVVVAMAWAMMGWLALLGGRRVVEQLGLAGSKSTVVVAVMGSLVLVTWDLFLDPQMVDAGHWRWLSTPGPRLHGIPVVNSVGWFTVGVVMVGALQFLVPVERRIGRSDAVAWLLLGWTWFSECFAHIVFFGRPWLGVIGGIAMSSVLLVVVKPTLLRCLVR